MGKNAINLLDDIKVSSEILLNKEGIILEGNGKTIMVDHAVTGDAGSAGILVSADGITMQNVKVVGPNNTNSWQNGQYVIKIYNAKNTAIKDVELTNGSGAVQVNGSTVTISGSLNFHTREGVYRLHAPDAARVPRGVTGERHRPGTHTRSGSRGLPSLPVPEAPRRQPGQPCSGIR